MLNSLVWKYICQGSISRMVFKMFFNCKMEEVWQHTIKIKKINLKEDKKLSSI